MRLQIAVLACLTLTAAPATALVIQTVAGTGASAYNGDGIQAVSANIDSPWGVAVDAAGDLYLSDHLNHRVRKVEKASGLISTVAGNGVGAFSGDGLSATAASVYRPSSLALDRARNLLYLACDSDYRVRRVDLSTGIITTVAGTGSPGDSGDGGPGTAAQLRANSLAVNSAGDLFIGDPNAYKIRKLSYPGGTISTFAGTGTQGNGGDGGPAAAAQLSANVIVHVDAGDNVYVGGGYKVRRIDPAGANITSVAGTGVSGGGVTYTAGAGADLGDGGPALSARFWGIQGLAVDAGSLYVADGNFSVIRKVDLGSGIISLSAGAYNSNGFSGDGGAPELAQLYQPLRLTIAPDGVLYFADNISDRIRAIGPDPATPTATPTPSPFLSATATPSFSASPTASPTHTSSPTPTLSPSPTPTATATASPSPTHTVPPTGTSTPTPSPSGTATATPTRTPGPANTSTPTPSPAPTAAGRDDKRVKCLPNHIRGRGQVMKILARSYSGGLCSLKVNRASGRVLNELWQGHLQAQEIREQDWDTRESQGAEAPSGVYYVVFTDGDGGIQVQKVLIVR